MLNIGVIGAGVVGEGHLQAISKSDLWHLTAVAEINPSRLRQAQERFRPEHGFIDYHELLNLPGLDAVVVATHVETHHSITVEALSRNLHVLCEKPMADTMEKCRQMNEAAEKYHRLLAINFNTRSGPEYRTIKRLIDEGQIGKIRVVRFVYDWSAHQWQPFERLDHFMKNGGPIIDSAVHFFEGIRWFTGQEFTRIEASGVVLPPYDAPQHAIATCELTDGAIGLVEVGWLFTRRTKDRGMIFNITVIGDDGTIDYNACDYKIRYWTRTDTQEIPCPDEGKHFEIVHANLAAGIRENRLIELASGTDGYKATEAAYRALNSILSRK